MGGCYLRHELSGGEVDVGLEVGAAGCSVTAGGDNEGAVVGGIGSVGGSLLVGTDGVHAPGSSQDVVLQHKSKRLGHSVRY